MSNVNVVSPVGRTCFLKVFKPEVNEMSGKTEYSVALLFPKNTSMKWLEDKWNQALQEEFGTTKVKGMRPLFNQNGMSDFGMVYDGDYKYEEADTDEKKAMYEAYREHWAISLKTTEDKPPFILDKDGQKLINPNDFQSGYFGFAAFQLSAFYSKKNKKNAMSCQLLGLRLDREGDTFGTGGVSEDTVMDLLGARTAAEVEEL